MIDLKTDEEMQKMREGGKKLREVVSKLKEEIRRGVTTLDVDSKAESLIKEHGGEPSFKRVKGYHWSTCLPVNEQVVHTPPSDRVLKEGDIITLDIGMYYEGLHTDFADTWYLGTGRNKDFEDFLNTGRKALFTAIEKAREGNRIGHISESIERDIYKSGYFILKQLTGHGIGKELHEDPFVPGFLSGSIKNTALISSGLTLAIEVIYSKGTEEIRHEEGSKWSIITADKSLSACFEHTIAIINEEPVVLT
ncbi:type I methionyl aminopeptidase [Candidatus Roizmanbacteria bacterium]|nr:type I methionyl aminopeptidase [Candidatus Roizmanbacteria bacterium]